MNATEQSNGGRPGARTINTRIVGARTVMVWDPLVRLIHWGLALCILLNATVIDDDAAAHSWIGYLAVALVITRLAWGVVGSRYARLADFPPNPFAAMRHAAAMLRGDKTVHLTHNPIGALMVYNLWITVLVLGLTGYMMGTVAYYGVEWVEEVHEAAFNWLIVSIVLHVGGVVLDTWRSGVPLVRSMISGRKHIPAGRPVE